MSSHLIKNIAVVNEGVIKNQDVLLKNGRIERIDNEFNVKYNLNEIDGEGKHLLPGIIDDQVHFREPGLTHKANIYTEAKAAVAGGVTTFMEMPNTKPAALTQELLQDKYNIAEKTSLANYSFFMGASNENISEVLKTDPKTVCGIKVFMGSSTGNMLVDDREVLDNIFKNAPMLVATHCEDEATIRRNAAEYKEKYGENVPISCHPEIRNEEACYKSSSLAIELAKKHDTRLHILHISTAEELDLFTNEIPLTEKRITSEVCVHHLWFDADDYEVLGTQVKCNPAVKDKKHKVKLLEALLNNRLDIIATDHAPHTWEEKQGTYFNAPSGVPLVQHSLNMMIEFYKQGKISLERIVEKMCHAPAQCFDVAERGYLREGYFADAVILDANSSYMVEKPNIFYKCGWSPFEGKTFSSKISHTFVNGHIAYHNGQFDESQKGSRISFNR